VAENGDVNLLYSLKSGGLVKSRIDCENEALDITFKNTFTEHLIKDLW